MVKTIEEHMEAPTKEILDQKITSYFNNYPRLGYDTRIINEGVDKRDGSDVYTVIISRQTSCD